MTLSSSSPRSRLAVLGAAALTLAVGASVASPALAAGPGADDRSSAVVQRAGSYQATLKLSSPSVVLGKKVTLSGKVSPAKKGTEVLLQKRLGDKKTWVAEKTLHTTGKGAFEYTDKPSAHGTRQYRVVVPGTGGTSKGTSKAVDLAVLRWTSLTKVEARTRQYTSVTSSVKVNAVKYAPAIVGYTYGEEGLIDWNLGRECTKLRGRFGNGDNSDEVAQANLAVSVDGSAIYTETFGLATSKVKTLDITGGFRVAFGWTSTNPAGTPTDQSGAQAVLAQPEVLCTF